MGDTGPPPLGKYLGVTTHSQAICDPPPPLLYLRSLRKTQIILYIYIIYLYISRPDLYISDPPPPLNECWIRPIVRSSMLIAGWGHTRLFSQTWNIGKTWNITPGPYWPWQNMWKKCNTIGPTSTWSTPRDTKITVYSLSTALVLSHMHK